jgi:hypothetical protein
MRLRQVGFWHGTGGLKVTVSSGNCGLFSPTGTRTCAPHIRGSSRAVSEWQPAYPRQLIIQTVHILQLDSAVTDWLPRGSVVRPFQPYFPITWPGSSTVTPLYQWRRPFNTYSYTLGYNALNNLVIATLWWLSNLILWHVYKTSVLFASLPSKQC